MDIMRSNKKPKIGFWALAISSYGHLGRALIFLFSFVLIIGVAIREVLKDSLPPGLRITFSGTTLKIGDKESFESILVDPRGWTNSGIQVFAGDQVIFDATGSINVALGHMIITQKYFAETQLSKPNGSVELFSKNEIERSLLTYPWNGPTGLNLKDVIDQKAIDRIRSVTKELIYTQGLVGQLLLLVYPKPESPELRTDISDYQLMAYYGPNAKLTVQRDGYLCFTVNDVLTIKEEPTVLNWEDNVGFFSVRLLIKSRK